MTSVKSLQGMRKSRRAEEFEFWDLCVKLPGRINFEQKGGSLVFFVAVKMSNHRAPSPSE